MQVGDICKYMPTSAVGKVKDIRETGGKKWALLDFTNLYYDIDYLTKADISEYKEVSYKEREIRTSNEAFEFSDKTAEEVNIDVYTPSGGG